MLSGSRSLPLLQTSESPVANPSAGFKRQVSWGRVANGQENGGPSHSTSGSLQDREKYSLPEIGKRGVLGQGRYSQGLAESSEELSPPSEPRFLATCFDSNWLLIPSRINAPPPKAQRDAARRLDRHARATWGRTDRSMRSSSKKEVLLSTRRVSVKEEQPSEKALQMLREEQKKAKKEKKKQEKREMIRFSDTISFEPLPKPASPEMVEASPENEPEEESKKSEITRLDKIASELQVPLDIAKDAVFKYFEHANIPDSAIRNGITAKTIQAGKPFTDEELGYMTDGQFGAACCDIAGVESHQELGEGFLENAMKTADEDGSGVIEFNEFLHFYHTFSFSEEVLVKSKDRTLRAIARKYRVPIIDLDGYKVEFDRVDLDCSGFIEFDEFAKLLPRLMAIPKGQEFPAKRMQELWRDARNHSSQKDRQDLDFDGFVGFYKKYFSVGGNRSPFETFYSNIRPVPKFN
eukprot:TRINITY_DN17323_c0_g1_i1.p1 TRINITY_DN17323_c0_g1~~TRINITY_DN17323_c0_g1_i1.p1  ORF type:complete len:465 (+),score=96.24 TRINITY_DN17323_c0_g1_i1:152-1546(+)